MLFFKTLIIVVQLLSALGVIGLVLLQHGKILGEGQQYVIASQSVEFAGCPHTKTVRICLC